MGVKEEDAGKDAKLVSGIEQCYCLAGYTGLSCETCDYGYIRLQSKSEDGRFICTSCDCNGHSPNCNLATGQCQVRLVVCKPP